MGDRTNTILLVDIDEARSDQNRSLIQFELNSLGLDVDLIGFNELDFKLNKKVKRRKSASNALEDQLASFFLTKPEIKLVVLCRELPTSNHLPFSCSDIIKACEMAYVPVCRYSISNRTPSVINNLNQLNNSYLINLNNNPPDMAKEVVGIFNGYVQIENKLKVTPPSFKKISRGHLVSRILGKEHLDYHFENYRNGPLLTDFLSSPNAEIKKSKITVFLLGSWLYNYVIKQPGIFLCRRSLCSYLNIDPDDFSVEVEKHFEDFRYHGPFGLTVKLWWRDDIDEFLADNDVDDGKELLSQRGLYVKSCVCSVDSSIEAGYFCPVTQKPISWENSEGGFSVLPPGADLSRINKELSHELISIIG